MEMTKEELRSWISEKVQKMHLTPPDALEQCQLLKSLLEKRANQTDRLLALSNSVAAYEAIVKELYALLGWNYTHTDSDEDVIEIASDGTSNSSPCDSETDVCGRPSGSSAPLPNHNLKDSHGQVCSSRKPKVVLTKLNPSEIWALCGNRPENDSVDGERSSPLVPDCDNRTDDSDFVAGPSPDKSRRFSIGRPVNTRAGKKSGLPVDAKTKDAKKKKSSPKTSPTTKKRAGKAEAADAPRSSCASRSKMRPRTRQRQ
ncbi:uncharacterized protein LOC109513143 isoform X2 [Hippocampus comes]|nr:PREDICTED: uncharacterized protein LOC109513143 isoform X2 [Hippocampus comes]